MPPQKPQTIPKKPQNQSRKTPTTKPQKKPQAPPQSSPSPQPPLPAGPSVRKSEPSSETFGNREPAPAAPAKVDDLILEARGGDPAQPEPGQPAGAASPQPSTPPPPSIDIKPAFAESITDLVYSGMVLGTRAFANGDLAPLTPDQRGKMSACMSDLAAKHLPQIVLANQEEVGAGGVLIGIWVTNYRPKPKEDPHGKQDTGHPGT